MANADQISTFGGDITRMSRSLTSGFQTKKTSLFIMDNWGHGTVHDDKVILSSSALLHLTTIDNALTLAATRDYRFVDFVKVEISNIRLLKVNSQHAQQPHFVTDLDLAEVMDKSFSAIDVLDSVIGLAKPKCQIYQTGKNR